MSHCFETAHSQCDRCEKRVLGIWETVTVCQSSFRSLNGTSLDKDTSFSATEMVSDGANATLYFTCFGGAEENWVIPENINIRHKM